MNDENENNKKVFRSFALPILTFDYLKKFQRAYQEEHRASINNNQALAMLLKQHENFIEGSE